MVGDELAEVAKLPLVTVNVPPVTAAATAAVACSTWAPAETLPTALEMLRLLAGRVSEFCTRPRLARFRAVTEKLTWLLLVLSLPTWNV